MARTVQRQDRQLRNSDLYDDSLNPVTRLDLQTTAISLEMDLNALRSVVHKINRNDLLGSWTDDVPSLLNIDAETKQRGIQELNVDLDDLETQRVLCRDLVLTDIAVAAGENWVILNVAGAEAPTRPSAIGVTTDRGTVTALSAFSAGAFAAHELVEVSGSSTLSPKNLATIRDATSGSAIQSSSRDVFGLIQSESTSTSGNAFDDVSGGDRVKISFVRQTATFDDLEAVPVADIEGLTIRLRVYLFRGRLEDLPEDCFLPFNAGSSGAGSDARLPDPTKLAHILYSEDASTWDPRLPITTKVGWLVNARGVMLVR